VVNDTTPPVLTNPGTQSNTSGTTINLPIAAVDADAGSFSAENLPPGLSISPNGVISGTLFAPAGTYQVTVSAADGSQIGRVSFPWVVSQLPTSVVITNVQNTYVGFVQVETVTAQVSDPLGIPVNSGFVTFSVNGETLVAPVSNGLATVTFMTPLLSLDMVILLNDFFAHALDVVFSDPSGIFGPSAASLSEPAMLLDFLLFLQTAQVQSLLALGQMP